MPLSSGQDVCGLEHRITASDSIVKRVRSTGAAALSPRAIDEDWPEMGEEAFMFRVIAGLTLCVGLAATAAAEDATVARGEKLFADQKCTLCHSIGDKGNKKGPLDGVAAKLKDAEIREWIVDAKGMIAKTKAPRKPEMKAYTLPKEDVDGLVAYLMTLKK
jgi:mono/diheme cytochrome c family protein